MSSSSVESHTLAAESQVGILMLNNNPTLFLTIYLKIAINLGEDDEKLLMNAICQNYTFFQSGRELDMKAINLCLQDQEYIGNIKEVQVYLDKMKKIVRPGCSQEVLDVAVSSMSSLVRILSVMSPTPKPHASL